MPPIQHSPQSLHGQDGSVIPGIMPQGIKRSRQACDTCRRKKSRCTGEKPVCATCKRLKQECSYKESFMASFPDRYKDIENQVLVRSPRGGIVAYW
jgi:Fungal Zn(2)-Cys(6) binuclear cluster domain